MKTLIVEGLDEESLALADVGGVEGSVVGPVELGFASVAVDAFGVVTTVLANTAALVVAVDIQRQAHFVHLSTVLALIGMTETVASCSTENDVRHHIT